MTEQIIFTIVIIHLLADFGLQTHEQATNKSSSDKYLFYHVAVYSLVWLSVVSWITPLKSWNIYWFTIITFWAHFFTDFITSRISKGFFDKKDFHNGFVVVGFDQALHFIQLYFTFKYLL